MAKSGNTVAAVLVAIFFSSILGFALDHFWGYLTSWTGNVFLAATILALPLAYLLDYFTIGSAGAKDFRTFAIVYLIVLAVILLAAWGLLQFSGLEEVLPI